VSTLYLYGITRAGEVPRRLANHGVSLVEADGRAAIVSKSEAGPLRATRKNLLAHADTVEEIHAGRLVLPTRFGTLLDDEDAARELLALPEIEQLLEAHADHSELTLKGTYEDSVLAEVSEPLEPLRETYRRSPTMENGVALGEAVTEALQARRARDVDAVLSRLRPLVVDVVVSEPVGELGALDLALLVRRDAVDAVSAALDDVAAALSPPLHLRLVGPLPPYSFVTVDLPARV
jgi:hypothetical protein